VFGMTGVERGRLVHWSHMLAVRPEWRDRGLGRRARRRARDRHSGCIVVRRAARDERRGLGECGDRKRAGDPDRGAADVFAAEAAERGAGPRWRQETRRAFQGALGRGYRVRRFYRDPVTNRCFYVLARGDDGF